MTEDSKPIWRASESPPPYEHLPAAWNGSACTGSVLRLGCRLAVVIFALGLSFSPARTNVIGHDDRIVVSADRLREEPEKYIGRLSSGCTATLVGARLILTANHCANGEPSFTPEYNRGDAPVGSFSVVRWIHPSGGKDWAVGILERDFGERMGWLSVVPANYKFI